MQVEGIMRSLQDVSETAGRVLDELEETEWGPSPSSSPKKAKTKRS